MNKISFDNIDIQYVREKHSELANNGTRAFLTELLNAIPEATQPRASSEIELHGRTFTVTVSARANKLEARQFVTSNSGLITFHKPSNRVLVVSRELLHFNKSNKTNANGDSICNATCDTSDGVTKLNIDLYNDTIKYKPHEAEIQRLKAEVQRLKAEIRELKC